MIACPIDMCPTVCSTPSDDERLIWPEDAVAVGYVQGAWGVRGAIKVIPFAKQSEALYSSKRWYLRAPTEADVGRAVVLGHKSRGLPALLKVIQAKAHGEGLIVTAQGLEDRDGAESLKGAQVCVLRSSFPTPAEDEYYWVDLVGLTVLNREGLDLGTVKGLLDTGVHSVLEVQGPSFPTADGHGGSTKESVTSSDTARTVERLIPFVSAYIDTVDKDAGMIRVDWSLDWD